MNARPNPVDCLIDSASEMSLINESVVRRLGIPVRRRPRDLQAFSHTGHSLNLVGVTDLTVNAGGQAIAWHGIAVTSQEAPLLLGWPHLEQGDAKIFSKVVMGRRRRGMVQFGRGRPLPAIYVSHAQFVCGQALSALTVEHEQQPSPNASEKDFHSGPPVWRL